MIISILRSWLSKARRFYEDYKKEKHCESIKAHFIKPFDIRSDDDHLQETMQWLCRAQDVTRSGGVSAGYYLLDHSWGLAYPETTGYIIETFLHYADLTNKYQYRDRAIKMGDWEVEIQLDSRDCRAGDVEYEYSRVFNTGQIILGWYSLYNATSEQRYLDAAVKASDWLVKIQDADVNWSRFTYIGPITYHSIVAWPLLAIYQLTNDNSYREAAIKNLDWVVSWQFETGWFEKMTTQPGKDPNSHAIAYTIRGLLESSLIIKDESCFNCALKTAQKMLDLFESRQASPAPVIRNYLPATFDGNWRSNDNYSCLTGNAQIGIIWLKLYKITGEKRFLFAANKIIDQIKENQDQKNDDPGVRGGIPGSYPIDGEYCNFMFINWAAKFFSDAIMLKMEAK